ncbi:hypothetical protein ABZY06_01705 [Streptomyces sp. NPDC006540]|uniref:hypothetical protein n=1 Tax=Streptomyces sp. NPDC006540 TaxID=3155353 RepID=UPI0033BBD13E
MKRPAPTVTGVAAVLLALPLLAGCGTVVGDGPGATPTRDASSAPAIDHEARAKEAKAAHDRKFPEVAKVCADAPAKPSEEPTPSAPTDPRARRVAENHAYKTQARLDADARCRGDAHARRITAGLEGVRDEKALRSALGRLGYPPETVDVYETGAAPGFTFSIPDAGPCITGTLTEPAKAEAHGHYVEGGCTEPKGGH